MTPLSPQDLLQVWESGHEQHPVGRALTMLAFALPDMSREELSALTLGQRDAHLLALREQNFGAVLASFIDCPRCAQHLEFTLQVTEVRVGCAAAGDTEHLLSDGDYEIRFRLPDSCDFGAMAACRDIPAATRTLVRRCVLEATHCGRLAGADDLPEAVLAALSHRMAQCDGQADVVLDLSCPQCDNEWQAIFDIAAYLWREIAVRAKRVLREVHTLARAYGWEEHRILQLSPLRRRCYLELVD